MDNIFSGTPEEFQLRRRALGLRTQGEAAPMFGATLPGVAHWEAGRRTIPAYAWRLLAAYEAGYRPPDWPQERWKKGEEPPSRAT